MGISCVSLEDLQLKEKVSEQMIFLSAEEDTEERFRAALNENESLKRISAIISSLTNPTQLKPGRVNSKGLKDFESKISFVFIECANFQAC